MVSKAFSAIIINCIKFNISRNRLYQLWIAALTHLPTHKPVSYQRMCIFHRKFGLITGSWCRIWHFLLFDKPNLSNNRKKKMQIWFYASMQLHSQWNWNFSGVSELHILNSFNSRNSRRRKFESYIWKSINKNKKFLLWDSWRSFRDLFCLNFAFQQIDIKSRTDWILRRDPRLRILNESPAKHKKLVHTSGSVSSEKLWQYTFILKLNSF